VNQADLGWNGRFVWSFGLTIAALIITLVHLIITFVLGRQMVDACYVQDPCRDVKLCVQRADTCRATDDGLMQGGSYYMDGNTGLADDTAEFEAAIKSFAPEEENAGRASVGSGLIARLAGSTSGRFSPAKRV